MFANKRNRYILLGVIVVVAVAAVVLIVAPGKDDKESKKTYKVGIVNLAPDLEPVVSGLKARMTELGYTEGENITYVYNGAIGMDTLQAETQNLIDQKVDVIVSMTTPATAMAKTMTAQNGIPVVFVPVSDPVADGIVANLGQPGGNITGIATGLGDSRRLEWLKTVAPSIKRVLYPYSLVDLSSANILKGIQPVADTLGLQLVPVEIADEAAIQAAIANIPGDVDAIFLPPDTVVLALASDWIAKAKELKLPTSAPSSDLVQAGILCAYSFNPSDSGKLAAGLVSQILKGTKPGALPIQTVDLNASVNLITAQAIGLQIPQETLDQAQIVVR